MSGPLLDLRQAWRCIEDHVPPLGREVVPLEAAHGRVLAEAVHVDRDAPAFDRAAMDGFAVCRADLAAARAGSPVQLRVVGEAAPGRPGPRHREPATAIRIMTGAAVPEGWDAIVPVEETPGFDAATIGVEALPAPAQHVVRRGSERRGGEVLLQPGRRLCAADIGALAMVGAAHVAVGRRARVAVLATGNELVPHAAMPGPAEIRDSNTPMLQALSARAAAVALLGAVPDAAGALRAQIDLGLASDLLLVTGGNSMGAYDLVSRVLEEAGVRLHFTRVAIQPGKPTSFGTHAGGSVLALPGNPVSALTTFRLFGALVLACLEGEAGEGPGWHRARARFAWRRHHAKWVFLPGRTREDGDGVERVPYAGSGDLLAWARADCQIVLPPEVSEVAPGDDVIVWPMN